MDERDGVVVRTDDPGLGSCSVGHVENQHRGFRMGRSSRGGGK